MTFANVFTTTQEVNAGGFDAHVGIVGAGPDVVLLHGNPDTHTVWSAVASRLAAHHRCIAPDMPGFGGTPAPANLTFSLDEQGGFVRDLLDGLKLQAAHIVVHDVGGAYGCAFAAMHPERVKSLTIFNTSFFPDLKWHFWARVWRTRVLGELAMTLMTRSLFVREMRRGSPRIPRDYAAHAYASVTARTKRDVLRWYRAMTPAIWNAWDTRFATATAKTPKHVIWGDLDPFLIAATADRYGGTAEHLADAGHWVMLEEPDRAAAAIAATVARG